MAFISTLSVWKQKISVFMYQHWIDLLMLRRPKVPFYLASAAVETLVIPVKAGDPREASLHLSGPFEP